MTRTSRLARRTLAASVPVILASVALGTWSAVAAPLSSVPHMSVAISPPPSAAGALTTYVVGFTTSATAAGPGNSASTVTLTFPSGTGPSSFTVT